MICRSGDEHDNIRVQKARLQRRGVAVVSSDPAKGGGGETQNYSNCVSNDTGLVPASQRGVSHS